MNHERAGAVIKHSRRHMLSAEDVELLLRLNPTDGFIGVRPANRTPNWAVRIPLPILCLERPRWRVCVCARVYTPASPLTPSLLGGYPRQIYLECPKQRRRPKNSDRWANSGGKKGSRDLPYKAENPFIRRRYGTVTTANSKVFLPHPTLQPAAHETAFGTKRLLGSSKKPFVVVPYGVQRSPAHV